MTFTGLQELIDALEQPSIICDKQANIICYNKACNKRFQLSDLGLSLLDNTSLKSLRRQIKITTSDDSSFDIELKLSNQPDSFFWTGRMIKSYELFLLQIKDQEEEKFWKYKTLAENAYDINIMFKGDKVLYVSPSLYDFTGYFENEVPNMPSWFEHVHHEDKSNLLSELKNDQQQSLPFSFFTFRFQHKKGHYIWLEVKIKHEIEHDGSVVHILTAMDVTKRKAAESELAQQKVFIEELFDSIPNLIFVKDGNDRVIYCNKAVERICGINRDLLTGSTGPFMQIVYPNASTYATIENKVINEEQEILIEEKIIDHQKEEHYFQTIKKPLVSNDGDVHLLSVSTNINRIKFYQKESERAMQEKNQLFSVMSHEVRTPINAITGLTDILLKREPRQDQKDILATLKYATNNLHALANDVLDFQKIDSGSFQLQQEEFSLKVLLGNIKKSYDAVLQNEDLNFILEQDGGLPELIVGDEIKISQILNNLINNAIKFTQKGEVKLWAGFENKMNSEFQRLIFQLSDTGIGIPEDQLKNVFKPFQQVGANKGNKFGGTGLGLSIVQKLVEAHKGKIEIYSKVGEGTTFKFYIEVKKSESFANIGSISTQNQPLPKLNISVLYVEDVTTNQYLIEEVLQDWGVNIVIASDGFEAINKVQNLAFDVILMDLQMPGIDGFETTRQIQRINGGQYLNIPIIALSAGEDENLHQKVKSAGMQNLLSKPINIKTLYKTLAETKGTIRDAGAQEKETLISDDDIESLLNFNNTDKIFSDNRIKYKEYLNKIVDEFDYFKHEMIHAIHQKDLDQVRRVNHKMKSTVTTHEMSELERYIETLKKKVANSDEDYSPSIEEKRLLKRIEMVKEQLLEKIGSLKWH